MASTLLASSSAKAAAAVTTATASSFPPLVDIAVNLTDCVFVGIDWKGKRVHPDDFENVMDRAAAHGVRRILISGTSLVQCARAIRLCRAHPHRGLFCTVGVHPANSSEFLVPLTPAERRYVVENGGLAGTAFDSFTPSLGDDGALEDAAAIAHHTIGGPLKFDTIAEEHRQQWVGLTDGEVGADENIGNEEREGDSSSAVSSSDFGFGFGGRPSPFEAERLALLEALIEANRDIVAAVGECGLDGAELAYCPYAVQSRYYKAQLALAAKVRLPLFLHSRDCGMRFVNATKEFFSLQQNQKQQHQSGGDAVTASGDAVSAFFSQEFPLTGVVHSFTGDDEELAALLAMNGATPTPTSSSSVVGDAADAADASKTSKAEVFTNFFFGLNGSAFRTEEAARRSVSAIPLDRLLLETDAPWCDIRKDNFGHQFVRTAFRSVKKDKLKQSAVDERPMDLLVERRNEPCTMVNVLECYVGCRELFLGGGGGGDTVDGEGGSAVGGGGAVASDAHMASVAEQLYKNTVAVYPLLASE